MAIAGMPGVVGAISVTHIKIIAPSKDEYVFVNRNKVHSINTQIVFDATFNILDVVAKLPGSTHDSRILMELEICSLDNSLQGAFNRLLDLMQFTYLYCLLSFSLSLTCI